MMKRTPESFVLNGCLHYLQIRGIYHWRNNTGTAKIADRWVSFGKKGSADILGCLPDGKFLAVEVKSDHGRLSPEQSVFLERIRGSGGLAVVVKSWQELDGSLREAGYVTDGPLFEGTILREER
jgi:hypothetical protein